MNKEAMCNLLMLVVLIAAVGNADFVYTEDMSCDKEIVQVTGTGSVSVLNLCSLNKIVLNEYVCDDGDCTITDQDVRNHGGVFKWQKGVIAYTTANLLFTKIPGHDWVSVAIYAEVVFVSVVEKDERTFLVSWCTVHPRKIQYRLVTYGRNDKVTKVIFKKSDYNLGYSKVVYVKAHNSFFVTAVDKYDNLVCFLIDAETGSATSPLEISFSADDTVASLSISGGNLDIALLSDGVTVGISRVVHRSQVWKEVHTAVRVVAPNKLDLGFAESSDFDEDMSSQLYSSSIAVVPIASNSFITVHHTGDSFKFVKSHVSETKTVSAESAGSLPFDIDAADLDKFKYDLASTGKGFFLAYTDGDKLFTFVYSEDDNDLEDWAIALIITGCVVVIMVIVLVVYKCYCSRSDEQKVTFEQGPPEDGTAIKMSDTRPVPTLPSAERSL